MVLWAHKSSIFSGGGVSWIGVCSKCGRFHTVLEKAGLFRVIAFQDKNAYDQVIPWPICVSCFSLLSHSGKIVLDTNDNRFAVTPVRISGRNN